MTRIAVVADIHSNAPSLEAVVDDIQDQWVDEVLVGGDLVGRGPQGAQVVEMVEDLGWAAIRGNHEDYVLEFRRHEVPDEWLVSDIWAASRWMANELDDHHVDYLDALPFSRTPKSVPGARLVHGSPTSYHEGIGPWTSDETLREHLDSIDEHLLICAHTHRPLDREVANGRAVNVGSVGLPFNGDPRAQYAIFERRKDDWNVEFRKVEYDRELFLEIYRETGFLDEGGLTASILRLEVREARPFLVPFLKWTEIEDMSPSESTFGDFLEVYDEEMSMKDFFAMVRD